MKHSYTYFALAISMLAALSCAKKELSTEDTTGFTPLVIKAVVDEDDTKTTYTWNEGTSKYEFSWNENDYVAVQVFKGGDSSKPDQIKFIAQSDGSNTTLKQDLSGSTKFDLTPLHNTTSTEASWNNTDYTLGDYAFYPKYAVANNNDLLYTRNASGSGDGDSSTDYVKLHESIPYVPANPTSVIPIIGKKESGDGTPNTVFKFRTATGVLKISLKQIPAGATKLVLTSKTATDALSGEWLFAEDETYTNGIQMGTGKKNSTNTKTITFSDLSGLDSYTDFYVPIPVGTINGLIIDIKKDDATLLWRVSTDEALTITRGVVTELPGINMTSKGVTGFSVTGTSASPGFSISRTDITRICFDVSSSETNVPANYPDGLSWNSAAANPISYSISTWDASHTPELSDKASGLFYLHYVALSSDVAASSITSLLDKRIKSYGSIPFYFLSSADNTAIVGTYTHATDDSCNYSTYEVPATSSFSFIVSTTATSGNVMVSNVDGTACTTSIPAVLSGSDLTMTSSYNYNNAFASDRYLLNGTTANNLVLHFTNDEKSSLYVNASQFGIQHYSGAWYYVYNAGSAHIYTKQ